MTEPSIDGRSNKDDDPKADEAGLAYDDDSPNLVFDFVKSEQGKACLKRLATRVLEDFEAAWDSTEQYRQKKAANWKIITGDLPPKTYPHDKTTNAHVPMALENLSRLTFRVESELFGDWTNVFGVVAIGPDDEEKAELLTRHGNWQIRNQITDFRRQMSRATLMFFADGDVSCHSYWDPHRRRNKHEVLTCDQFVIPYVYTTTEPDYSDVPFKCKVLRRYRHELQAMKKDWYGVPEILERGAPDWDDDPQPLLVLSATDVEGVEIPDDVRNRPYVLIHWEGYFNVVEGEDDRYVKAIVDKATRGVALMQINEEVDWQDKIRFDRENVEMQGYMQARQVFQVDVQQAMQMEQDLRLRMSQPDVHPDEAALIDQAMTEQPLPTEPPPRPGWMDPHPDPELQAMGEPMPPKPPRKVPIQMFAHGVNMEPLVHSLGIGQGRIQCDLNRAINVATSQFADAAHLANSWSIISPLEFEGDFKIAPGRINRPTGMGGAELKDSIYELKPMPANPQLLQLVEQFWNYGQSSIQAPDVLSGESGKSGETYRGLASRIEQATKQLSVSARKEGDFVEQVLKNNGKLNAQFLPDEEIVYINDHRLGRSEEITVGRRLYERDYRVAIRADMRFSTTAQRVAEADEALQLPTVVPPMQGNLAYYYYAAKKALEARSQYQLIEMLGPPPPPPMTPLGFVPMPMPGAPGAPGGPGGPPPGGDAPIPDPTTGAPTGAGGPAPAAPPPAPAAPQ